MARSRNRCSTRWRPAPRARRLTAAAAAAVLASAAHGAPLEVTVVDRDGEPVSGAAVAVTPADGSAPPPAPTAEPAVMSQADREFRPHVLVVQKGARVRFPNHDDVNHHVYSFSSAKRFELELYKGNPYPPLAFEHTGIVTLGCNIHDDMLGYIVVVDTPWFAKTGTDGGARFDALPADSYAVSAWTPRLPPDAERATAQVRIEAGTRRAVRLRIEEPLMPPRRGRDTSLPWADY